MIPFPEVRLAGRAGGGCDDVVQHLPQWGDVGFVDLVVKRLAICGKLGMQNGGNPLTHKPRMPEKPFKKKTNERGNTARRPQPFGPTAKDRAPRKLGKCPFF